MIAWIRKAAGRMPAILRDRHIGGIVRTAGVILTGNAATSVFGFVSFAIVASSLGPELLAYFALAQVYVLIVNDLFNVQTWESLIKFGATRAGGSDFRRIAKTNIVIDVASALLAFVIAFTMIGEAGRLLGWDETLVELARLYSLVIPFTLTTLTIGVPRLYDRFTTIVRIQLVSGVIKLLLVLCIQFGGGGVREFLIAYLIADVLTSAGLIVYSLALLRRHGMGGWLHARIRLTRDEMRFMWWTNLRSIVRIPVRQLDLVIMNQFLSMHIVGVYKTYKEIVGVIGRLGDPLNQVLYPEYAKLIGRDRVEDSLAVTKKISMILLSASIVTLVGYLVGSHFVISRFLGEEYLTHMPAYYLLVVLGCINLYLTPVNSLFTAAGFARLGFYIVLVNNILYLAASVLGSMYLGIYGLVLAFALQMTVNQGLKIYFLKRHSTGWSTVIR